MNIRGNRPPDNQEINRAIVERSVKTEQRQGPKAVDKSSSSDRVDISSRSREIAELMARIEKLPDVREDKIKEIREAIQSGRYEVDPQKIAEKILREL